MPKLQLSAVIIPEMRATLFVVNLAPESVDRFHWTIDDDVHLDVPNDLYSWPDGVEAPGLAILCKSIGDSKHYKVFKRAADVHAAEFAPTETAYGGVYSESHWAHFVQDLPRILKFYQVPDTDPPGALEEVLQTMKRAY